MRPWRSWRRGRTAEPIRRCRRSGPCGIVTTWHRRHPPPAPSAPARVPTSTWTAPPGSCVRRSGTPGSGTSPQTRWRGTTPRAPRASPPRHRAGGRRPCPARWSRTWPAPASCPTRTAAGRAARPSGPGRARGCCAGWSTCRPRRRARGWSSSSTASTRPARCSGTARRSAGSTASTTGCARRCPPPPRRPARTASPSSWTRCPRTSRRSAAPSGSACTGRGSPRAGTSAPACRTRGCGVPRASWWTGCSVPTWRSAPISPGTPAPRPTGSRPTGPCGSPARSRSGTTAPRPSGWTCSAPTAPRWRSPTSTCRAPTGTARSPST
jgi:hypothetical protein